MRLFFALLFVLAAGLAQADCTGRDLRDHLTPHGETLLRQSIAETPYAVGNHWIARKAGRQIHIIGTMHDGDLRMNRIMTRLRPVIRAADVLFLEVTAQASDAHIDQVWRSPSVFLRDAPPYLPDLLSDAAWTTLSDQLAAEDFNPEVVARMQPWFAGFFLDSSRCGGGFGAGLGLDDRLERAARAANVAIRSLEPPGAALSAVSSQPLVDQVLMLEWDLTTQQSLDDQIVTTANSYFDERLAEGLWVQTQTLYSDLNLPRAQVTRVLDGFYRRLIDDRNRNWLPVIDQAQGPIVVVAVGGAHLPGHAGLVNLLAARGYRLERAPF